MDLSTFRKEYSAKGLRRADLAENPFDEFTNWFELATKFGIHEPNAMVLSTVAQQKFPSQRTVLLKSFDTSGFTFFTNYTSRKAQEIAENPQVSILFPWITMERQVSIQGRAEKIPTQQSLEYFRSRPRESQIGAWVSHQSSQIPSRSVLENRLHELESRFQGQEIPLPDFWGGYRIVPTSFEFWQGGPARIHDRFVYNREQENSWSMHRISP